MDAASIRQATAATMSRYVQFDTTNPPGNEMEAARWLAGEIAARGITHDIEIYEPAPKRGLLVARIPGSEHLKPLLLNHHIDVVSAEPAQWTYPPFSGTIADGFVWGRGTLDTKFLGVIFLHALESLLREGARPRRPILYVAVPDEETGGSQGMRWLVENHLASLDPEWVWDEGSGGLKGILGPEVMFAVGVAEKQIQHLRLVAHGDAGHGSMPHANNAVVTLLGALGRILQTPRPMRAGPTAARMFRDIAAAQGFPSSLILRHLRNPLALLLAAPRLASDRLTNAVMRDTISLNTFTAGCKVNVIPERAEAQIDCRLLPDTDAHEFHRWLRERIADERVSVEIMESSPPSGVAPVDGPFFRAAANAISARVPGARVFPLLVTGATDGRYFRSRGYAAYGLGPVIVDSADIARMHGVDERISEENLLLGVRLARDIISELCL